ncbi:hypothetical protein Ppha_2674 [Pelodictyon phaeoclathratiforme BU-1]|jgi:hypothetical protein|uniref:Uncharacterized protein n=1 Tax=Pelodictyon phaeoclathratiforme (strain DSM 5477 / BU-1) TaxID=324925 RepID=B4SG06_PELPB|nr:hypothetical protein Ppha_2674 [Pelodictyon phaeoclathratiforme BU-1]
MQSLFTIIIVWFHGTLYSSGTVLYLGSFNGEKPCDLYKTIFYPAYDFNQ